MIDVDQFIKGDEKELEKLMSQLTKPLMRYCSSILLNFADAEDAVQTTFIKAYKRRHTLKNPAALNSFIYRIAYSVCVDIIRSRKLFFPLNEEVENIREIEDEYFSEVLHDALLKLSPFDRALVYSRIVEEYSYKELSEIHKRTEVSLRKRYERARNKLQRILKKMDFEEEGKSDERKIYKEGIWKDEISRSRC